MRKRFFFIIIILLSSLLVGCWDMIEINDRDYISALGIDLYEGPDKSPEKRFVMTYVYPNINAIGKKGSSNEEERFVASTVVGSSPEGSRQFSTRADKPFFFKHMKALFIGENLAKEPKIIREFLDDFSRDPRVNTKLKVIVVKGKAKDVVKVKPKGSADSGMFVDNLMANNRVGSRYVEKTFTSLLSDIYSKRASILPKATASKDDIKIAGGGIVKDYELIGWIDEKDSIAINLLLGKLKSDMINTKYSDTTISYIISNDKSKKDVQIKDGNIKVIFNIKVEGYLQGYKIDPKEELFKEEKLNEIERTIEKKIREDSLKTIGKLQKEYKVDVLKIDDYLSKFHPDLWDNIKNNWDTIFPNIDIDVVVDAKIRRIGFIR